MNKHAAVKLVGHRVGGAVVIAVALLSLAACGSSAPQSVPVSTTTPATTLLVSPGDLGKQKALAAYTAMWQDVAAAGLTSDWRSPRLAQNATGEALSVLSRAMYADHYNGLVSRGQPINRPTVDSAEPADAPTTIMISDCGDSTNWLHYRVDNGQLADDKAGGRRFINAEVKLAVDASWKVARFAVRGIGSC